MPFTKEERVMFEDVVANFEDGLVIGKAASRYNIGSAKEAMRRSDRVWRPMPYIAAARDGIDQTGNFTELNKLAVPVSVTSHKAVTKTINAYDIRDKEEMRLFGDAAKLELSSEVNTALNRTAAIYGTNFVRRDGNPTGFDDLAEAEARMDEIGVPKLDRVAFLATRDYNPMAANIAARGTFAGDPKTAYEAAKIPGGKVAGFSAYKNDTPVRLAAAAPAVAVTVAGANQRHVPRARNVEDTENFDNRTQLLTVSSTAGLKPGDAFAIAGVESVHMQTKEPTGQAHTSRIIEVVSGTILRIAPAIVAVDHGAPTQAEREYQNVTATPANGAAITFLNTKTGYINPFFTRDSLLLVPGTMEVPAEAGWESLTATSELGIQVVYTRQGNINDLSLKTRWDLRFGTAVTQPQFAGALAFRQA